MIQFFILIHCLWFFWFFSFPSSIRMFFFFFQIVVRNICRYLCNLLCTFDALALHARIANEFFKQILSLYFIPAFGIFFVQYLNYQLNLNTNEPVNYPLQFTHTHTMNGFYCRHTKTYKHFALNKRNNTKK